MPMIDCLSQQRRQECQYVLSVPYWISVFEKVLRNICSWSFGDINHWFMDSRTLCAYTPLAVFGLRVGAQSPRLAFLVRLPLAPRTRFTMSVAERMIGDKRRAAQSIFVGVRVAGADECQTLGFRSLACCHLEARAQWLGGRVNVRSQS